jgi:hypothetical protein
LSCYFSARFAIIADGNVGATGEHNMTGYTVHTGSNKKFAAGWEQVFGTTGKSAKRTTAPRRSKQAAPKKRKK